MVERPDLYSGSPGLGQDGGSSPSTPTKPRRMCFTLAELGDPAIMQEACDNLTWLMNQPRKPWPDEGGISSAEELAKWLDAPNGLTEEQILGDAAYLMEIADQIG